MLLWLFSEFSVGKIYRRLVVNGKRGGRHLVQKMVSFLLLAVIVLFGFGSLLMMLVWSFAGIWRFPALIPDSWQATYWINLLSVCADFQQYFDCGGCFAVCGYRHCWDVGVLASSPNSYSGILFLLPSFDPADCVYVRI